MKKFCMKSPIIIFETFSLFSIEDIRGHGGGKTLNSVEKNCFRPLAISFSDVVVRTQKFEVEKAQKFFSDLLDESEFSCSPALVYYYLVILIWTQHQTSFNFYCKFLKKLLSIRIGKACDLDAEIRYLEYVHSTKG